MKERLFPELALLTARGTENRMTENRGTANPGITGRGTDNRLGMRPTGGAPLRFGPAGGVPSGPLIAAYQQVSLADRLRHYIAKHGVSDPNALSSLVSKGGDALIIGSNHQLIRETCVLEEKLLASGRFRYYGSEEFVRNNARRQELEKVLSSGDWRRPPRWLVPFRGLLATAQANNVQVLHIGDVDSTGRRDRILAEHLKNEFRTRERSERDHSKATLLLSYGGTHASRLPLGNNGQNASDIVRNRLAGFGLNIVSAYVMSDRVIAAGKVGQRIIRQRADTVIRIRGEIDPPPLLDLTPASASTTIVPMRGGSPFDEITYFESNVSFEKAFDFMILHRA